MSDLLPPQRPSPLFSYYPSPVSARERVHLSLLSSTSSSSSSRSGSSWTPRTSIPVPNHASGAAKRSSLARAQRRALTGRRPPGASSAADLADLSDEEAALDEEKAAVNQFGHRFLMPFGRRMTLGEMETAPSPTPSDPSHRQEELRSPSPPPEEDEEEAAPVDLDADLEDMDAEDEDDEEDVTGPISESAEYGSDDVQLLQDMDQSEDMEEE